MNTAELAGRADAAVAALATARAALAVTVTVEEIRDRLVDLVFLGVPGAVPVSARGTDPAGLLAQATAVERDLAARVLPDPVDRTNATPEEQVRHDLERLRVAFGPTFVAMPLIRPANGADLERAFAASTELQGGDPLQAHSWLLGAARVRPGASRLQAALAYGAALDRPAADGLDVAQLPVVAGARWTALPDPPAGGHTPGTLSLVAHRPLPVRVDGPFAGLLVDEWTEVVPTAEVTTGIAFHHEAPGVYRGLSALYVSHNPEGAALSTDFTTLGD